MFQICMIINLLRRSVALITRFGIATQLDRALPHGTVPYICRIIRLSIEKNQQRAIIHLNEFHYHPCQGTRASADAAAQCPA